MATDIGNPTRSAMVTHPTSNAILDGLLLARIPIAPTASIIEVGITQLDIVITALVVAVSVTALLAHV